MQQHEELFHYEGSDLEVLFDMPHYQAWILERLAPWLSGHTVEYGAGLGAFSRHLLASGRLRRLTLVEPDVQLVDILRQRLSQRDEVDVAAADLLTHAHSLPTAGVDTIVMINVLEHIEDDAEALIALRRVLRPGGALLIFVPALPALMSELDRLLGHYRRYTRRSLRALIEGAGLTIERCDYFDLPGVLPWLVINRWMGATGFDPRLARIYDWAVVPWARRLESRHPPPLGKNLLVAARVP